jgi:hypothetical protein
MSNNFFFFRKSCLTLDIVEKYCTGKEAMDDNVIRHIRFACWIIKATYTHSEYVIFMAFERQQLLSEGTLMLRHM